MACCLAASLALSGCKEIHDMNVFSSGSGEGGRSDKVQGKFIDSVRSDLKTVSNVSPADQQEAWDRDVGYVRYGNKTVANLPELQQYLGQVLATLGNELPGGTAGIKIYITPQQDFEA